MIPSGFTKARYPPASRCRPKLVWSSLPAVARSFPEAKITKYPPLAISMAGSCHLVRSFGSSVRCQPLRSPASPEVFQISIQSSRSPSSSTMPSLLSATNSLMIASSNVSALAICISPSEIIVTATVKQKGDIKGFAIIVVDWKGGANVSN